MGIFIDIEIDLNISKLPTQVVKQQRVPYGLRPIEGGIGILELCLPFLFASKYFRWKYHHGPLF